MSNITLNIAQADILNKFKSLQPKDIEVDFCTDENEIVISFPFKKDFDLVITLDSEISYPDEWSILCENTKFKSAEVASHYCSELDEECVIDLSFMVEHIENFIVSDEYVSKREVFFDTDGLRESYENAKESASPMSTYGLTNSDFI